MFDFGDLTVLTAAESGIERMQDDPRPDRVQEGDARREARVRGRHGALPAGRPRRRSARATAATVPTHGRAPARPPPRPTSAARRTGVAAARPRRRVDPDEVTRTLASLADLRDRGAITAEEYERKKAELLARL